MKKLLLIYIGVVLFSNYCLASELNSAQQRITTQKSKYTISGVIKDRESGETLPYANIIIDQSQTGTSSNKFGYYSITLTEGSYTITYQYVGYYLSKKTIELNKDTTIDIEMSQRSKDLEEVVIKPENTDILSFERRLSSLEIKNIKEIPASLGEADVLRSCQSLPGVTSISEAGGGFFVRGGAWDQNLMLLDEAIVYNAAHMEGFYSVFNPEILKDVKFYKGGIPANYGGRISSIMDITQKEGNMKSYHLNAGIGLISSKLMIEGPLIKEKASFIVAARRSYIDIFFKYLPNEDIQDSKYYFYDINTKLNFIFNSKNRLYFSLYSGDDQLEDNTYYQKYSNLTTTLRWNHIFGNRLFSNTSLIYSNYDMEDGEIVTDWTWKDVVGIDHYEFKNNFSWFLSNQKIDFGLDLQYLTYQPGNLVPVGDSSLTINIKIPDQYTLESALYLNDNIKIKSNLEILLGIRLSDFKNLGAADIYIYDKNFPKSQETILDTIHYSNNKVIKQYTHLEPRISIKYNLNRYNSLLFTYNRMVQYVHRISNNLMVIPYNMYKPSNNYLQPIIGDQVSLGYFTTVLNSLLDISAELYFKKMKNIIEVKPGADITLNKTLDADLLQGKGKAYGLEIMADKKTGKLIGSVSYTYSRSLKQINGKYKQETLNFGEYFPAHYDIPHQFKILGQYKLNKIWSFNADFIYLSGRPINLPDGQYIYAETLIPYYSGINQHKLPDFHRLNIGVTRYSKFKPERQWNSFWNFSVYNVYAKKNAHSIIIRRIPMTRDTEAVRFTIIETIVPTLSYNFEF